MPHNAWKDRTPQLHSSGLVTFRNFAPMTRRSALIGSAALGAALAASHHHAFGQSQVNFMGWQDYDTGIDTDGFFEKNGIELNATYMTDNNELIATAQHGGIGNMDIITPDLLYAPFMAEIGMLTPLDLERIPNFDGLFGAFKTMPGANVGGTQYCLPFAWGNVVLMYNADVIKEPPMSWFDMLKPEFAGKVGLTAEMTHLVIPMTKAVTGTDNPTRITREELDETYAVLTRIKKEQARVVAAGFGETSALLGSGEILMAPAWEPMKVWAGEDAPNLQWTHPKEGSFSFVDNIAIITEAPNLDLALTIANHAISPEAQAKTANMNSTAVTVPAAVPLLDEGPRSLYPYDDVDGFWASRGGGMPPIWPIDPEGEFVTFDEVLEGWEAFLQA